MEENDFTNWQAIGIGCLVAIGASVLVFLMGFSVYFLPFMEMFVAIAFPLSIIGAMIGRYISRTWIASLLGAMVVVILEFFLIFSTASKLPLD
jgi:hypothetical protein